jgi:hypothetical protein
MNQIVAKAAPDVMACMITMYDQRGYVLFDPRATYYFILYKYFECTYTKNG